VADCVSNHMPAVTTAAMTMDAESSLRGEHSPVQWRLVRAMTTASPAMARYAQGRCEAGSDARNSASRAVSSMAWPTIMPNSVKKAAAVLRRSSGRTYSISRTTSSV